MTAAEGSRADMKRFRRVISRARTVMMEFRRFADQWYSIRCSWRSRIRVKERFITPKPIWEEWRGGGWGQRDRVVFEKLPAAILRW